MSCVIVEPDRVNLHVLWRRTCDGLDRHHKRVAEGKGVEAAQEFAQYIIWSGLPKLLSEFQQGPPLTIDGPDLLSRAQALLDDCHAFWKSGRLNPNPTIAAVADLNRKFDLMAGALAQVISQQQGASNVVPLGITVAHREELNASCDKEGAS